MTVSQWRREPCLYLRFSVTQFLTWPDSISTAYSASSNLTKYWNSWSLSKGFGGVNRLVLVHWQHANTVRLLSWSANGVSVEIDVSLLGIATVDLAPIGSGDNSKNSVVVAQSSGRAACVSTLWIVTFCASYFRNWLTNLVCLSGCFIDRPNNMPKPV